MQVITVVIKKIAVAIQQTYTNLHEATPLLNIHIQAK